MSKGDATAVYHPDDFVGAEEDELILKWLRSEFERISAAFESAPMTFIDTFHVEPDKPREGMIVVADGTDWDPGFGAGSYLFLNGAWQPMFTTSVGAVTSVDVAGTDGIGSTGGPITSAGVITLSLGNITPDSVASSGTVIGSNLSGTNTGDQTSIVGITGTLAQFNTALTGADFASGGGVITGTSSGTNTGDQTITLTGDVIGSGTSSFVATLQATAGVVEIIQDSIGTILVDSARIDFTYNDGTPSITADIVLGSVTETYLGLSDVTTLNSSTSQHGFLKKLSNNSAQFMDGAGNWTTPGSTGGVGSIGYMLTLPTGYGAF